MNSFDRVTVWSWGGGVQTIAILCLVAKKLLPKPELAIMADTGRERTATWRYHEKHAKPLLDDLGIPFVIASHKLAKADLYAPTGEMLLPAYTETGKLPTFCSSRWKKEVVRRKLRQLGYGPKAPILMWFGMSLDEVRRLRVSDVKWIKNHYPLCFDVKKRRYECLGVIHEFGLPEPPNSCCWMCPNMRNTEWIQMKDEDPDDFEKAILLEKRVREKDIALGESGYYLHGSRVTLNKVDFINTESEPSLFDMCSEGCFT